MKILLLVSFLSTLLIIVCSIDSPQDFFEKCKYPSGCLQPRKQGICVTSTHPYGYDSTTKTCRLMPRFECVLNTCNMFSTLEECKKECSSL
ncbi:hypothetical protein MTO96_035406 [Rhipicephalus appendiculatus]